MWRTGASAVLEAPDKRLLRRPPRDKDGMRGDGHSAAVAIREGQMSRVLTHYKNPDEIPERNMALMEQLGKEGLIQRFPPLAKYWPED